MTLYKVFYSSMALSDLDKIWDDIYEISCDCDIADVYIKGIRAAVNEMAGRPKSGMPLYYSDIFTGVYMVVYKKYIAFYRIGNERIEVGRVMLGSSDYLSKLVDYLRLDI